MAKQHGVAFPGSVQDFIKTNVLGALPAGEEAWLRTTNAATLRDVRPFFTCAKALGVDAVVTITGDGPAVNFMTAVSKWRSVDSIRLFIETCWFAGIDVHMIAEDLKRMWGVDHDEAAITQFVEYFVDREWTEGDSWIAYEQCVGSEESTFKRGLMQQPHEYVRWKLGVPVSLDAERVLHRLVSDAYFTERLLKQESGNHGLRMTKDELARVKLERETIFKGIDRLQKYRDAGGGDGAQKAVDAIAAIVATYESQDTLLTMSELT